MTLAGFALYKNPRSPLNRTFAAFLACLVLWSLENIVTQSPDTPQDIARLFDNIGSIGWISFSGFYLWLILIFTEKKKILKTKILYLLLFGLPLVLLYKNWAAHAIIKDLVRQPYGWSFIYANSVWTYLYFSYYMAVILIALYLLVQYGKSAHETNRKKQVAVMFFTTIASLILGTINDVVLPELNIHTIPPMGNITALIWAGGMIFAMERYKLLVITPTVAADEIISRMSDSLVLLDAKGNIAAANNATLRLLGYTQHEIAGEPIALLLGEKTPDKTEKEPLLWKGLVKDYETSYRTKTGALVPVILSCSVVRSSEGGTMGVVMVAHDISERKKTQDAVLKEKNISAAIINSLPGIFYLFDDKGNFLQWNKNFETITGYAKEEIREMKPLDIFGEEDKQRIRDAIQQAFFKGKVSMEADLMTKSGEKVSYLFSGETFDIEGVQYLLGTGLDINQRMKKEKELERINMKLEGSEKALVNILSDLKYSHEELQNTQAQLIQSAKLASLGKLIADIAHEINNPLMIILGRAQLSLMEDITNEELKNNLHIIMNQCDRAKGIIQRLLMFSKQTKGEVKNTDINQCIEFTVQLIEHQFSLKNVKIIRQYEPLLPSLRIDEKRMHEIFLNLLNNAQEAMPNGGAITITTSSEKNTIRIDFKDAGVGIPKENIAKIFDPFFTTKEKGTGLGLSICYSIIKAYGGEMRHESKPGEGTTAIILLPIEEGTV